MSAITLAGDGNVVVEDGSGPRGIIVAAGEESFLILNHPGVPVGAVGVGGFDGTVAVGMGLAGSEYVFSEPVSGGCGFGGVSGVDQAQFTLRRIDNAHGAPWQEKKIARLAFRWRPVGVRLPGVGAGFECGGCRRE